MKQQSNNEKQRVNKPSSLLSREENELVFALLGRKCQVSFFFFMFYLNIYVQCAVCT